MTEISDRLRHAAKLMRGLGQAGLGNERANLCEEAANEIDKLNAEVAAWRERFPVAFFDGTCIVLSGRSEKGAQP